MAEGKSLSLSRIGLNLAADKNRGEIQIRMRSDQPIEVSLSANGKEVGKSKLEQATEFSTVELGRFEAGASVIKTLKLSFESSVDSKVEIDWVKVD